MRNTPATNEQAQANLQATKALLELRQRGYLYAAERRPFGWIAVIKKGAPPVVMHSAKGVMEFVANHGMPQDLEPVRH